MNAERPFTQGIISIVVGDISPTRLTLENVAGERLRFAGLEDIGWRFPSNISENEELDANLEFVFDFRDFILGDWLFDLVETLFGEQVVVPERTLGIFG